MIDRRSRGMTPPWISIALILCFACACLWFAPRQNIWIDESTQLSGITLSPGSLVQWLAGTDTARFGVPGDRMPPLGYLIDWAWWNGVSQSIAGFRLFHAALVVVALGIVAWVERTYVGGRWAVIGLVFLAVSPKTIQFAVELRAYPMLFAMACIQAALFLRMVAARGAPTSRSLVVFGLACIATCFIHFFGVVATGAYFGALLLRFLRTSPARIVVAGIATMIPTLGLKPFVTGATALSDVPVIGTSPVQYVLQLFAGSAYLVLPVVGVLFIGGCLVLLALGVTGAAMRLAARRTEPVDHMVVVALLGVGATVLPHFFIHSFDTLKPSYSIWLLPVLALIIASGARFAARPGPGLDAGRGGRSIWFRRGVQASVAALALGATISTAIFLLRADWYVHGPANAIATARQGLPADTPIVYVGADTYAYGYFPTVYLSQRRANQWLAQGGGVRRLPDGAVQPWSALSGYANILVVEIMPRRYGDLGQCLRGACPLFDRSPVQTEISTTGSWREAAATRTFGYYDASITRMSAAR